MPVSRTVSLSPASQVSALRLTSPTWVNFTALLSRLDRIWVTRTSSPR